MSINHQTRKVSRVFYSHKVPLWAFKVILQTEMTDFPSLSYTSTSEIPTLSHTPKAEKGTASGRSLPVKAIIGSTPLPLLLGLNSRNLFVQSTYAFK